MKLGFIGLGRMGKAMVEHLLEEGVDVVVYNRSSEKTDELKSKIKNQNAKIPIRQAQGRHIKNKKLGELISTYTPSELISKLEKPRVIWLMVPHGSPVDDMIEKLLDAGLTEGDIVIDGGNSFYKDSIRRYHRLKQTGIHFLDIGTSGGLAGARYGACLMVGGDKSIYVKVTPWLRAVAKPKGDVAYFGSTGAGHFVKMVHNGVEYGMLQAIGEGFEILARGIPVVKPSARGPLAKTVRLDLHEIAENWSKGSVVRGWLVELLEAALKKDPKLSSFTGQVGGGETGEWTIKTAKELEVDVPVLQDALLARKKSLDTPTFSGKVISALRREFGGHKEK